jgi:OHCU decarboxylase
MEVSPEQLQQLNQLSNSEAEQELLKCCGSVHWAREVAQRRPYHSVNELLSAAERVWWTLQPDDWLEAFRSHPKIGEKKAAVTTTADSQKWSAAEQSAVNEAGLDTAAALADLNRKYEEKFGYIYIVCATGKTANELLANLRDRMNNEPQHELRLAASEQAKITELRLQKLLASKAEN